MFREEIKHMSLIDSFKKDGKPIINIEDTYTKSDIVFDSFIMTFSHRVISVLLEDKLIELVSEDSIRSISCSYPIYRFVGTNIGIIKTTVGAPLASVLIAEVSYIYSCKKAVVFGSCGALDKTISTKQLIVPTEAFRDEGTSYHYMEPSDFIKINGSEKVSKIFNELEIKYIKGKTWTTDAFYRETKQEVEQRKREGCIVVEMELSACQAVCNYYGIDLYSFLYRADNLDCSKWDKGQRDSLLSKDERLGILNVAFEIAKRL